MEQFTFEEMSLLRMLDNDSRDMLRGTLVAELHDMDEHTAPEVINLFCTALEKLDVLTDEEYETVSAQFYEEEDTML